MLALGVPSSSFSRIVPAVAVYLISWPPIFSECLDVTIFSSGGGGVFFSSFGFSAGLSAGFCAGCWAKAPLAWENNKIARLGREKKRFIVGGLHRSYFAGSCKTPGHP